MNAEQIYLATHVTTESLIAEAERQNAELHRVVKGMIPLLAQLTDVILRPVCKRNMQVERVTNGDYN